MLPNGKIVFYNNMIYSRNASGQAISTAGFTFKVTFDTLFKGKTWTLTGGHTVLTGIVPDNYYSEITVSELNTNFTLSCEGYSRSITSAPYYGYATYVLYAYNIDFNANSWSEISSASQRGLASSMWNVGATKTIHLNGTVGHLSINQDVQVFIIGFNHNSDKEGANRIHIQIGKNTSGDNIAFCDDQYNDRVFNETRYFTMNSKDTNRGGWNATTMKNTILHSGNTPLDTGTNTFMAALPSDLRAVMKPCTKYTDNVGDTQEVASHVTATTEHLPLLSEFEVFGGCSYANKYEQNWQTQYDYYKAGNSKKFNGAGARGSYVFYWLRSPFVSSNNNFCRVMSDGTPMYDYATASLGVAPVFFV